MSYLERNLSSDDGILKRAVVNPVAVASSVILGVAVIFIGGFSFIALIIAAILIGVKILIVANTELGLTTKKVLGKTGVINTKVMDAPIGKVNSVMVEQGLIGKIFGYSKVIISTSSGAFKFDYIKNADDFRGAVMHQVDKAEFEKSRKQAEELAKAIAQNK